MNDDHPTSSDPGAPYRHPELRPLSPRPFRYHRAPYVGTFLDRLDTPDDRFNALSFEDWFNTWLSFGAEWEELQEYMPPHLAEYQGRIERGEI